jgi:hypothetical protein
MNWREKNAYERESFLEILLANASVGTKQKSLLDELIRTCRQNIVTLVLNELLELNANEKLVEYPSLVHLIAAYKSVMESYTEASREVVSRYSDGYIIESRIRVEDALVGLYRFHKIFQTSKVED